MKNSRRALLSGFALAAAGLALPVRAQEPALEALMRSMAVVRERRESFTEEKAIPELDLPLPSQGTLHWAAPDRLEKHTTSPFEERLRVQGNRMLYERPDRGISRQFGLDEQPEMRALVESIRATLAGDLAALRRHYDVSFSGVADGDWRMVLTPLSVRLRAVVQRIVLVGRGVQILAIETDGGGGITRMQITPLP
ncbi:MAG: hypothetical protein QJR07_11980 [Acetobacteraceae bacterium]|nr:hypothetical protein [Acetobacteraceae bacterium]